MDQNKPETRGEKGGHPMTSMPLGVKGRGGWQPGDGLAIEEGGLLDVDVEGCGSTVVAGPQDGGL